MDDDLTPEEFRQLTQIAARAAKALALTLLSYVLLINNTYVELPALSVCLTVFTLTCINATYVYARCFVAFLAFQVFVPLPLIQKLVESLLS